MGTRSITRFLDHNKVPFASMYAQFDGYPTGVGSDIVEALKDRQLVNGYNNKHTQTNGIHCAVALLIAKLKTEAGGVYLYGPEVEDQEYNYMLWAEEDHLMLSVQSSYSERVYIRKLTEFDPELAEEYIDGEEE